MEAQGRMTQQNAALVEQAAAAADAMREQAGQLAAVVGAFRLGNGDAAGAQPQQRPVRVALPA